MKMFLERFWPKIYLILYLSRANLTTHTGKYFSEALILASTNPQYDDRLLIELRVQYMKIASSEYVVYSRVSNNKHNME